MKIALPELEAQAKAAYERALPHPDSATKRQDNGEYLNGEVQARWELYWSGVLYGYNLATQ